MDEAAITQYILDTFAGVETAANFGYTFFFYGADRKLPFATMSSADNEYDRVSNLDRPGVFRLNIGVGKATFQALFGAQKIDVTGYDFTALDTVMPHPEYAAQSYVCVLSRVTRRGPKCKPCWRRRTPWPCAGNRSARLRGERAAG